jgi:hypothetical protein
MPSRRSVRATCDRRDSCGRRRRGRAVLSTDFVAREVRSFESHVGGLWHLISRGQSSRRRIGRRISWIHLFGMLDDRSRLSCHLQWYPAECRDCGLLRLDGWAGRRGALASVVERQRNSGTGASMHDASTGNKTNRDRFGDKSRGRLLPMLEGEIRADNPSCSILAVTSISSSSKVCAGRSIRRELFASAEGRYCWYPTSGETPACSRRERRAPAEENDNTISVAACSRDPLALPHAPRKTTGAMGELGSLHHADLVGGCFRYYSPSNQRDETPTPLRRAQRPDIAPAPGIDQRRSCATDG